MNCPACGNRQTEVLETRGFVKQTQRRRCCPRCGCAWVTIERTVTKSINKAAGRFGDLYGPDWKTIRSLVLVRDGGTCQGCGSYGGKLDVHHDRPARLFPTAAEANDPSNLTTLCKSCHRKADRAFQKAERG